MLGDDSTGPFSTPPLEGRHLFVVARLNRPDDSPDGGDLVGRFVLTRGYWDERDADEQARILNDAATRRRHDARYFVLVVRVSEPPRIADPLS